MDWGQLIIIIASEGIPVAEYLVKKWESGAVPTSADFDELRGLASQHGEDRMKAALVQAGIPLDSDKAKMFLALTR
jgi:hypothetical protein